MDIRYPAMHIDTETIWPDAATVCADCVALPDEQVPEAVARCEQVTCPNHPRRLWKRPQPPSA
jgi:hypothetical protein